MYFGFTNRRWIVLYPYMPQYSLFFTPSFDNLRHGEDHHGSISLDTSMTLATTQV
jgi:hypothetical protein